MAGSLNKLTAKEAAAITTPGRHADGGNLFLRVRSSGSKTCTFLYERTVLDPATGIAKRKQTEIGLGPYGSEKGGLTLAEAREQAIPHRRVLADKGDPLEVMRAKEKASQAAKTTFADFVKECLDAHRAGWSNSKHAKQWETTLGPGYCKLLQTKPIADIGVAEILEVLARIWSKKPETARRVSMRLERVLNAAKAKGLRSGENPARWRAHLDHLLKKHRAPWPLHGKDAAKQFERSAAEAGLGSARCLLPIGRSDELNGPAKQNLRSLTGGMVPGSSDYLSHRDAPPRRALLGHGYDAAVTRDAAYRRISFTICSGVVPATARHIGVSGSCFHLAWKSLRL